MTQVPEELHERIAAYIDGELSPADAARFEVFLANTDPGLADEVLGMIADRHRMKLLPRPTAPSDLSARVMEQIERTSLLHNVEHIASHRRPWWHSRAAIAACFAVVLGGFTYFMLRSVLSPSNNDWRNRAAQEVAGIKPDHAKPVTPAIAQPTPTNVTPVNNDTVIAAAPANPTTQPTLIPTPDKQPANDATIAVGPTVDHINDHTGDITPITMPPLTNLPTTAPSIANATPSTPAITHTTDQPAKVLASLPSSTANQPVVVTFVPHNNNELGMLAAALDNLDASNRRELARLNGDDRTGKYFQPSSADHSGLKLGGPATPGNAASDAAGREIIHVLLHPSQIDDLASQYHIAILARGNDTYAFPGAPTQLPPTADAKTRAELLKSANVDPLSSPTTQPASTQPFIDCIITLEKP